jgi:hypothetical protein
MTFLNPTALLALFAAAIPIIIHFLNLKKLKKVEFSSIVFLKELQKTKIKRIRIRQLIILALRVLIILFIVMAFSKPAIRSLAGFSSSAKTTAVIILDNSFSMSVVDIEGSLLNQAKQAAKKILDNLNTGDEISIILTSDKTESIEKPSSDFYKLKNRIDNTQISNISIPIYNSLLKAQNILTESQSVNKELYILTDLQKEKITPAKFDNPDFSLAFNKYTRIYLPEMPSKKISNLSATDLTVNSQILEKGKTVSFTAAVSNYSDNRIENSVASLFINGKRVAQQGVSLEAGSTRLINYETTLNETGLLNISVELEDDDILNDNKRCIGLYVPEKISVAAFCDEPLDLKYINLAVELLPSQSIELSSKYFSQINSTDLSKYNVVLLCGSETIKDYTKIRKYLENKGNIIFFPGDKSSTGNYNKLCNALNIPPALELVDNTTSTSYMLIDKIDFRHPVFQDLFEKSNTGNFSSPQFSKYFNLKSEGGKKIMSFTGQSSFLTEHNSFNGRVLQFASAPLPAWSDFPLKSIFAPAILRSISYLSVILPDNENNSAGDILSVKSDDYTDLITAVLPSGDKIIINPEKRKSDEIITFRQTEQTGLYKFFTKDKLIKYSSLNFDSKESDLRRITVNQFEQLLRKFKVESGFYPLNIKSDLSEKIKTSRFGMELWKHFFIAALILAITEMFLARTSKKDIAGLERQK